MRSEHCLKQLVGFLGDCLFTIHYHEAVRAERRYRHNNCNGVFEHGVRSMCDAFKRCFRGLSASATEEGEDWVQEDEEIMADIDRLMREFDE